MSFLPEPRPHQGAGLDQLKTLVPIERLPELQLPQIPSIESARWIVRVHGPALRDSGALFRIQGRLWFQPEALALVLLDVGQRSVR